ncbi:MAG TPA: hypothetical protein VFJ93_01220 [Gaiellaceae bacterium]|nr:hypothetical protein [Gaiellaceae bacterium]
MLAVALLAVTSPPSGESAAPSCAPRAPSAYTQRVRAAVASPRDLWGEQVLRSADGPTYESVQDRLAPILFATRERHKPLTPSGAYAVPLAYPQGEGVPLAVALHVADGSAIISRHATGPSVELDVGASGGERYGACVGRLVPATLADGWLPIVDTSYADASGVRYTQESFAGRIGGARSIVSFVKLDVDATESTVGAQVRFKTAFPDRLVLDAEQPVAVAPGATATVYAAWVHQPPLLHPIHANAFTYGRARDAVVKYWQERIADGLQIDVPDEHVADAARAILVQNLVQGWRYSIGNLYEELSFAEALDTSEVMGEYGYAGDAQSILKVAIDRLPTRFTAWRFGELLLAEAAYYRLYHDRALVHRDAGALASALASLAHRQQKDGMLLPEPLSSDLGGAVNGLPAQVVAWAGLRAMAPIWTATRHTGLATRAARISTRLEAALRRAVEHNSTSLSDGSLFVPLVVGSDSKPYGRITFTREGSYWNLLMPYAFASGFFTPGGDAARGILRYLAGHGAWLLGVTRADAHISFHAGGQGLGQVYGLETSRFLADNDRPDELSLSLYGMLGTAMTPTYVSGEAISVLPVRGSWYRTMYMPPNLGANSTYLETLRLTLVHESTKSIDLAFSTPRAWLAPGGHFGVRGARTRFGRLSYKVQREGNHVRVTLDLPRAPAVRLRLRLPLGSQVLTARAGSRRLKVDPEDTVSLPRRGHVVLTATVATSRAAARPPWLH